MIRDIARQLDKQVKLEIVGKSTAVDRDILKTGSASHPHSAECRRSWVGTPISAAYGWKAR
jgi:hypothetical protein